MRTFDDYISDHIGVQKDAIGRKLREEIRRRDLLAAFYVCGINDARIWTGWKNLLTKEI